MGTGPFSEVCFIFFLFKTLEFELRPEAEWS